MGVSKRKGDRRPRKGAGPVPLRGRSTRNKKKQLSQQQRKRENRRKRYQKELLRAEEDEIQVASGQEELLQQQQKTRCGRPSKKPKVYSPKIRESSKALAIRQQAREARKQIKEAAARRKQREMEEMMAQEQQGQSDEEEDDENENGMIDDVAGDGAEPRRAKTSQKYRAIQPYDDKKVKTHRFRPGEGTLSIFSKACEICGAKLARKELKGVKINGKPYKTGGGLCCSNGHVFVPELRGSDVIMRVLQKPGMETKSLWLNTTFAMASVSATKDERGGTGGVRVYRVQGSVAHIMGKGLEPESGEQPIFAQLYLYTPEEAADTRARRSTISKTDVYVIEKELRDKNRFARTFASLQELRQHPKFAEIKVVLQMEVDGDVDKRRYNLPTAQEVAILIPDTISPAMMQPGGGCRRVEVTVKPQLGEDEWKTQFISEVNADYDGLAYPMLFPHGERGWHPGLKKFEPAEHPLIGLKDKAEAARQERARLLAIERQQRQEEERYQQLRRGVAETAAEEARRLRQARERARRNGDFFEGMEDNVDDNADIDRLLMVYGASEFSLSRMELERERQREEEAQTFLDLFRSDDPELSARAFDQMVGANELQRLAGAGAESSNIQRAQERLREEERKRLAASRDARRAKRDARAMSEAAERELLAKQRQNMKQARAERYMKGRGAKKDKTPQQDEEMPQRDEEMPQRDEGDIDDDVADMSDGEPPAGGVHSPSHEPPAGGVHSPSHEPPAGGVHSPSHEPMPMELSPAPRGEHSPAPSGEPSPAPSGEPSPAPSGGARRMDMSPPADNTPHSPMDVSPQLQPSVSQADNGVSAPRRRLDFAAPLHDHGHDHDDHDHDDDDEDGAEDGGDQDVLGNGQDHLDFEDDEDGPVHFDDDNYDMRQLSPDQEAAIERMLSEGAPPTVEQIRNRLLDQKNSDGVSEARLQDLDELEAEATRLTFDATVARDAADRAAEEVERLEKAMEVIERKLGPLRVQVETVPRLGDDAGQLAHRTARDSFMRLNGRLDTLRQELLGARTAAQAALQHEATAADEAAMAAVQVDELLNRIMDELRRMPAPARAAAHADADGHSDAGGDFEEDASSSSDEEEDERVARAADAGDAAGKNITMLQFYSYVLMERERPTLLHWGGYLFQQYIVDMWAKVVCNRLAYISFHQEMLRGAPRNLIQDVLAADVDANGHDVGKKTKLPQSFNGSPRNMFLRMQDALAIANRYGKPHLFITMTCNPNWREITEALGVTPQGRRQLPTHRPDIVTRVWHLKLLEMINDIRRKHIFGKMVAFVKVIEFQKRGLPHAHMLFWLDPSDAPTVETIDNFVRAELPDKDTEPELYAIITRNNLHVCSADRCGAMNDGRKCRRRFPKEFCDETIINTKSYPLYRRRRGATYTAPDGTVLDNRHVVPYNPFLSKKYNCHINVEICSTVSAIHYIFKYIHKGPDRAKFSVEVEDEVKYYKDNRYYSPCESIYGLFKFRMHMRKPTVVPLKVHLKGAEWITFDARKPAGQLQAQANAPALTTLTAFFALCESLQREAEEKGTVPPELFYHKVPEKYVWDAKVREWKPGSQARMRIGRLQYIPPAAGEPYFLRMLLTAIPNPTSFEYLLRRRPAPRPADEQAAGNVEPEDAPLPDYDTFKEAAIAWGLLEDRAGFAHAVAEVCIHHAADLARQFFAQQLAVCRPADARAVWEKHRDHFAKDHHAKAWAARQLIDAHSDVVPYTDAMYNDAMVQIAGLLADIDPKLKPSTFGLDDPIYAADRQPRLIERHLAYDPMEQQKIWMERRATMNDAQRRVFDEVRQAIDEESKEAFARRKKGKLIFLDGCGGSGKTFLYNAILAYARSKGQIAVPSATVGVAALLLDGGQTTHSVFKLPLELIDGATCNALKGSPEQALLRAATVIIIDEVSQLKAGALDAINDLLNDTMADKGRSAPAGMKFGNKIVIVGGDFRQTLPVIVHGTADAIKLACAKHAASWDLFTRHELTANMRVRASDPAEAALADQYKEWLLSLGNGTLPQRRGMYTSDVDMPRFAGRVVHSMDNLLESIYAEVGRDQQLPNDYFEGRCILTPKNVDVDKLNVTMADRFPGESHAPYFSSDQIATEETDEDHFPTEYLNSLTPNGLPPHKLVLKIGVPCILMRNVNTSAGLCNGTRVIPIGLYQHHIAVRIISGRKEKIGTQALIARIPMENSPSSNLPLRMRRIQFPLRLAFSMTINKAQGQSLNHVGIYLPSDVFSHGQLYVAFSRSTRPSSVVLFNPRVPAPAANAAPAPVVLRNVVFEEIVKNNSRNNANNP